MAMPPACPAPRQHLVLLVDDDDAHRRTLQRALHGECALATAAGGDEALAVLDRRAVSLVVTDQRMPGMTGVELLARIAARHPQVVRLLLTAYAEVATLGAAINTGQVYAFLSKPWQAAELRLTVRRGLEYRDAEIERGDLVRRLRAACAAAEREAARKTRLLALLAHELGTPAHIALNASALLAEQELPEGARRWVETLQRASRWMARGVAQVHRAAHCGNRPLPLRRRELDLGAHVRQIADDLRAAAAGRSLHIACVVEAGGGRLHADPHWLREAVWNLLTNAVRNTPDGGAIEIRVDGAAERACVAVSDSGVGIEAERFADLFEPFSAAAGDVQLHGSGWLAFGARGLGLGLALTRQIAEAHGGALAATSAVGAGSCFRLELPRAAPAAARE